MFNVSSLKDMTDFRRLQEAKRVIERAGCSQTQLEPGTSATDPVLYINTGFREALAIYPIDEKGRDVVFEIVGETYDATHGLDSERFIASSQLDFLGEIVKVIVKNGE